MCPGRVEDEPVEVSEESLSLSEFMMVRVETWIGGGGRDAFLNIQKRSQKSEQNGTSRTIEQM
jgi:hypothetical protein